jgi:hypothetical protein
MVKKANHSPIPGPTKSGSSSFSNRGAAGERAGAAAHHPMNDGVRTRYGKRAWRYEYWGCLPGKTAIHRQRVAFKFMERGRTTALAAWWLLVPIFLLIFVGVCIFLYPTTFSDLSDADSQTDKNLRQIEQILDLKKQIANESRIAEERAYAVAPLYQAYRSAAAASKAEAGSAFEVPTALTDAMGVLLAVAEGHKSLPLSFKRIEYQHAGLDDADIVLSGDTIEWLVDQLKGRGAEPKELRARILEFLDEPKRGGSATASTVQARLAWTEELFAALKASRVAAQARSRQTVLSDPEDDAKITQLLNENAKLISQATLGGEGSWARWAPIAVFRIGAVILFIFLTKILLETFRYLIGLSAFYRARGDAIQLLQESDSMSAAFDPKSYAEILSSVAPERHRIARVESPEGALVALLGGRGARAAEETSK